LVVTGQRSIASFAAFSGRGIYSTKFTVSAAAVGRRLILDLGNVKDVAEVKVNVKLAATLLLRPYQTDITEFNQTKSSGDLGDECAL
jgi:hypothetical protein